MCERLDGLVAAEQAPSGHGLASRQAERQVGYGGRRMPYAPVASRLSPVVTLLAALLPAQSGAAPPAQLVERIDAAVQPHLAHPSAVGLAVGVARGGEVVLEKGYGRAELEFDQPAGPATMFRIGSVTKQFTAALVMRSVERGQVALDDPLSKFVPESEFPTGGRAVTIRQLLNHTSGIPSYTDLGDVWQKTIPLELSHAELLALVAGRPFDFEPGTQFRYNNTGYYLLGMVLERVHGKPYARILQEELCTPLGLARTRYDSNSDLIRDRAQGYQTKDGALANDEPIGLSQPGAAGALLSTGGDLVRWSTALTAGKVVKPESYALMVTPTRLPDGSDTGYGFGLMVGEVLGRRCVQHGGGINGFASVLVWFPEDDLHVAVISNSERLSPQRVAKDIVRAVLGIEKAQAKDLPVDAATAQRVAGAYRIEQLDMQLEVRAADGKVTVQAEGQGAFRALWQGEGEFRAEFDTDVRLVFAADGKSFTLHQGGGVFVAKRVE